MNEPWLASIIAKFQRYSEIMNDFKKLVEQTWTRKYRSYRSENLEYETWRFLNDFLKKRNLTFKSALFLNNYQNCLEIIKFLEGKLPCQSLNSCPLNHFKRVLLRFDKGTKKFQCKEVICQYYYHPYWRISFFTQKSKKYLKKATSFINQENTSWTKSREIIAKRWELKENKKNGALIIPKKGFYLYGDSRKGKTWFLWLVMNYYAEKLPLHSIGYIEISFWINLIHRYINNFESDKIFALKEKMMKFQVLFIDDLGSENINHFVRDHLTNLIDSRMDSDKLTFITSNFAPEELIKLYQQTKELASKEIKTIKADRLGLRITEICEVWKVPSEENITNKTVI